MAKIRSKYLIFLWLVACFLPARAAAQKLTDTLKIKQVEVVSRAIVKVNFGKQTALDSSIVAARTTESLASVLALHTPVYIKSYGQGALATSSFRGAGASHTQVFWNGININPPMPGQVDFSLIPVAFADHISLAYGAASTLWGSGGLGGSIRIQTAPRWNEPTKLSFRQKIGSFSSLASLFELTFGKKKFCSHTRLVRNSAENDFEYLNNGILPHQRLTQKNASFTRYGIAQDLFFRTGKRHFFALKTWNQLSKRQIPTIMTNVNKGGETHESQDDGISRFLLEWKHYQKNATLKIRSAYFRESLDYRLKTQAPSGETVTDIASESLTNSWQNSILYSFSAQAATRYKAGLNANFFRVKASDYQKDRARNLVSAHLALEHEFSRYFSGFFLLRQEFFDKKTAPLVPALGFDWQIFRQKKLFFKVSLSRNFHYPSLNDLYWFPGGNPELKPEKGYSGDGGVIWQKTQKNWQIESELSFFASQIKDWILWQPSDYRYWTPKNVQQVFSRGIELRLKSFHAFGESRLKIFANYAFTRTTNQTPEAPPNVKGRQLIYIPAHTANASGFWLWKGFSAGYTFSANGKRYTTSDNSDNWQNTLPPYALHELFFGKRLKTENWNFELNFSIKNLFDTDYQAVLWRAMPGRHFLFSLKAGWQKKHKP